MLYGLDYSSVALIISDRYEDVYRAIDKQLDRGVTFLEGRGGYTGAPKTVLMTAVKSRQIPSSSVSCSASTRMRS